MIVFMICLYFLNYYNDTINNGILTKYFKNTLI